MDPLSSFDWILISSSAGKDSQAMIDVMAEEIFEAKMQHRTVVFHADLGRVEWQGTAELAEEHANHYGFRFERIARPQGDLLDHIEKRGKFPDAARRYCTSDHKRAQGRKIMTKLVDELSLDRPCRILHCIGYRREESPSRAKKIVFKKDESASNKTRRVVYEYCPILDMSLNEVWARIKSAGTRHHWAYDAGMPRLSCSFCVLASKSALVRAAQLRPDLANEYASIEEKISHRFRNDLSMSEIIEQSKVIKSVEISNWAA